MKTSLLLLLGIVPSAFGATSLFNIQLNYTGDPTYLPMFENAKSIWEQIIPSYVNGRQTGVDIGGLTITATLGVIDGQGGKLGGGGWTNGLYDDGGFAIATEGTMDFDSADVASLGENLTTVILHEMGHVLGLGTIWTYNNLYVDGSGQYTGAYGLEAYRQEFNQPNATFVPVELEGGTGTADSHWDEVANGTADTGFISNVSGSDMRYELMTGWLNTDQPYFISELTRATLRDMGYNTVSAAAPVPETRSILLAGLALGGLVLRRRR